MQHLPTPPTYTLLYPERYILCLLLPWQLWFLCFVVYPITPTVKTLAFKKKLYTICPHGEIIPFGPIMTHHIFRYVTIFTTSYKKSIIIIHKQPNVKQQLRLWALS
jgi:hypothetical protein